MSTHLVVLAVDTEPGDGDPGGWDWAELLDTPLPVGVVLSTEADDEWTVNQNLIQLSSLLKVYATKEA